MNILKKKPHVDSEQSFTAQRRLLLGPNSSFYIQEAYNTLRTNIRFAIPGEGCKRLCLTSGLASEGKSTTILNLAISFSETGSKVLLIDGDMRRPSLARLLIEKVSPGLSNVLAGLCDADEAIRQNVRPNLDLLFAGEVPPNPLELLGNPRMKKLIDDMSQRYDYILVDTPPVSIVSDACEVANVTDGVLFLVRQNETEKEAVIRGIKQLELSNSRLLGFVLNGIIDDGGKGYKYRYRYRYRYKYRSKYAYVSTGKKAAGTKANAAPVTTDNSAKNSSKETKGGK